MDKPTSRYSLNKKGGSFKPGIAFGLDEKVRVAYIFTKLKKRDGKTSINKLAIKAKVSYNFASRVMKEFNSGHLFEPTSIPQHREIGAMNVNAASTESAATKGTMEIVFADTVKKINIIATTTVAVADAIKKIINDSNLVTPMTVAFADVMDKINIIATTAVAVAGSVEKINNYCCSDSTVAAAFSTTATGTTTMSTGPTAIVNTSLVVTNNNDDNGAAWSPQTQQLLLY